MSEDRRHSSPPWEWSSKEWAIVIGFSWASVGGAYSLLLRDDWWYGLSVEARLLLLVAWIGFWFHAAYREGHRDGAAAR
jgi:hypothetical protein